MMYRLLTLAVAGVLVLTACSGPPQTSSDGGSGAEGPNPDDPAVERPASEVALASVETFDVSQYPVRPPQREVDVQHRVPERLLTGRATEGVKQTVDGYRVQVYSAQDKQSAEEFREQVRQWWNEVRSEAPSDLFSDPLPIVVEYGQPYYRVRVGAYASRERAGEALEFVRKDFGDAFVARSRVTVTR